MQKKLDLEEMRNSPQREAVGLLFAILYETLWLLPSDPRRANPLWIDFQKSVQRLAALLAKAKTPECVALVEQLIRDLEQMQQRSLFDARQIAEAQQQLKKLYNLLL